MDQIDTRIIEFLKKDARMPFLQIAEKLKVSEGTIRKRVKDLLKEGQIKKFTIETNNSVFAIVGIETETKTETKKITEQIRIFGVYDLYEVTGRFDIIAEVPMTNMESVNNLLEKIRSIKGVLHTETFTVLHKA